MFGRALATVGLLFWIVACGENAPPVTPVYSDSSLTNAQVNSDFERAHEQLNQAQAKFENELFVQVVWKENRADNSVFGGLNNLLHGDGDFSIRLTKLTKTSDEKYIEAAQAFLDELETFVANAHLDGKKTKLKSENFTLLDRAEEKRDMVKSLVGNLRNPSLPTSLSGGLLVNIGSEVKYGKETAPEGLRYMRVHKNLAVAHAAYFAATKTYDRFSDIASPQDGFCALYASDNRDALTGELINFDTADSFYIDEGNPNAKSTVRFFSAKLYRMGSGATVGPKLYCFIPKAQGGGVRMDDLKKIVGAHISFPNMSATLVDGFNVHRHRGMSTGIRPE